MADIQSIHLRRLHGQLGDIVYQLTRVQFSQFCPPETWSPAINAYLCRRQVIVCVDLAGVDKAALDLQVEPRRLSLRGRREPPEPTATEEKAVHILAMEIDYGPFERTVTFPADVDTERVRAEQRNGLLWVYLPLRAHA